MLEDSPGRSQNLSGRGDLLQFPNRTNLFFHGLHIDPAVNSPYRYAGGNGQSIAYSFKTDEDTSPGLNWYQSRVHGHSALHMMGGLFGAMVTLIILTTINTDIHMYIHTHRYELTYTYIFIHRYVCV